MKPEIEPVEVECPGCGEVLAVPLSVKAQGRTLIVTADSRCAVEHVESHKVA